MAAQKAPEKSGQGLSCCMLAKVRVMILADDGRTIGLHVIERGASCLVVSLHEHGDDAVLGWYGILQR